MMADILETPGRIEPCRLEEMSAEIADAVSELTAAATHLGGRLNSRTAASLADLVRIMNCYYSNLIESHHTLPRDIERALGGDLVEEKERRNLQVEAAAHIRVQREVDAMQAEGRLPEPASAEFIKWLHYQFYRDAPPEMLLIKSEIRSFEMKPGEFRNLPEHDVDVGRHVPPSSDRVEAFMAHFASRYRFTTMGQGSKILAMAAAHHRLNYIHPFPDGNGRVSRLMSHAMGLAAGIGAHGLWSIARGLARGRKSRTEYKKKLDEADTPHMGDLDGRGNLSLKALQEFVLWFLLTCLDQVTFMDGLFNLDNLAIRLKLHVERSPRHRPEAFYLLEYALLRGEMVRGDAARVSGLKERTAREVLSGLVDAGILASEAPKGPVSLRFPVAAAEDLFPALFPQT